MKIKGFVTPVIVANTYYLLRKTAKHEIVIDKLKQLLSFIEIVPIGKEVVIQALNSRFKDFEDALQNYAAVESMDIATILTRNLKDFKHSDLAIFTPETYIRYLQLHIEE